MKKTIILSMVLGVGILLLSAAGNVMAQKNMNPEFNTDKPDRALIKELVAGQNEIKSMLRDINSRLDKMAMGK